MFLAQNGTYLFWLNCIFHNTGRNFLVVLTALPSFVPLSLSQLLSPYIIVAVQQLSLLLSFIVIIFFGVHRCRYKAIIHHYHHLSLPCHHYHSHCCCHPSLSLSRSITSCHCFHHHHPLLLSFSIFVIILHCRLSSPSFIATMSLFFVAVIVH